eukprot:TRINITY_DN1696_c0_g1_i18.p2 TRINITY_DN1696_c0_g1~~TRINITY_DN1696_c0_g1_i18.p2  ORF type:complete len:204 (-),score=70.46 TRINITY_DN1696_c0_g1_i18:82-693(-)
MDLNMAGKATSSDPFCKIYLREGTGKAYRSWQTGLFAKNLNPVWTIPPWTMLYVANSTLTVSIFDKDFGRPDDFIGMVTIPLHALFERFGAQDGENEWTQCRFILCGEDGRENHRLGSLKFSFRYKSIVCQKPGGAGTGGNPVEKPLYDATSQRGKTKKAGKDKEGKDKKDKEDKDKKDKKDKEDKDKKGKEEKDKDKKDKKK